MRILSDKCCKRRFNSICTCYFKLILHHIVILKNRRIIFTIYCLFFLSIYHSNAQWQKVLGENRAPSQSIAISKYGTNLFISCIGGIHYSKNLVNIGYLGIGEYICVIKSSDNLIFVNNFIKSE